MDRKLKIQNEPVIKNDDKTNVIDSEERLKRGRIKIQNILLDIFKRKIILDFDDKGFFTRNLVEGPEYMRIIDEIYERAIKIDITTNKKPITTAIKEWFLDAQKEGLLLGLSQGHCLELIIPKDMKNAFWAVTDLDDFSSEFLLDFVKDIGGSYSDIVLEIYNIAKKLDIGKGGISMAKAIKEWCLNKKEENKLPKYILDKYFINVEPKEGDGKIEQVFFLKSGRMKVAQGGISGHIDLVVNLIKEYESILMKSADSAGFEETGRYLKIPIAVLRKFFKTKEPEWYNGIVKHYSKIEMTDKIVKEARAIRKKNNMTWNEVAKYLSEKYGRTIGPWVLRKGTEDKQALGEVKSDEES